VTHPAHLPAEQPLPDLRIVPAAEVHLHEDADPRRVAALTDQIRAEGVLRNPPLAAALPAGGFVVLDGANRTSALRALGVPFHLLQVVDYTLPDVRLEVWHHLLREDGRALAGLLPPPGPVPLPAEERLWRDLQDGRLACGLITGDGILGVRSARPFPARIRAMRAVVDTYNGRVPIYRVLTTDRAVLREEYDRIGVLVVFPRFTKEEILHLAALPEKLPTGITRHVIPHRALRVNLPLEGLRTPGSLEEKNSALRDLIHARLLAHRVRLYPEPTILFDD
jgi:hypothetical protein